MSTRDQALSAELYGQTLLVAQDERLQPLLEELAAAAEGRDDIRAEVAGVLAGNWAKRLAAGCSSVLVTGKERPPCTQFETWSRSPSRPA
jgi:hypothetical protein